MRYFTSLNTLAIMEQFTSDRTQNSRPGPIFEHLTNELRRSGASRTQASRLVIIHAQLSYNVSDYSEWITWWSEFYKEGSDLIGVFSKGFGRNNITVEDLELLTPRAFNLFQYSNISNLSLVNCRYNPGLARIVPTTIWEGLDLSAWGLLPYSFSNHQPL